MLFKKEERKQRFSWKVSLPVKVASYLETFDVVKEESGKYYHLVAGERAEQPNDLNSFLHLLMLPAEMSAGFMKKTDVHGRRRWWIISVCVQRYPTMEVSSQKQCSENLNYL